MSKILYFSADWCGPCKAMKPILEKFSEEYPEIEIEKIDVDEYLNLALEHKISSVPTFILWSDNEEEIKRKRGAFTYSALVDFVYGE